MTARSRRRSGSPPELVLVAGSPAGPRDDGIDIAGVFGECEASVVSAADLRVTTPWQGPLFDLIGRAAAGAPPGRRPRLGLLVPIVWVGSGPAPGLVAVRDHVDLRLRGPLTGRRPDGGPQVFPSLAGIYQPAPTVRRPGGRVYSEVAVAGVADTSRLTPFERRQLAICACPAVCDLLVDAVVVAALHGFDVAAFGASRGEVKH